MGNHRVRGSSVVRLYLTRTGVLPLLKSVGKMGKVGRLTNSSSVLLGPTMIIFFSSQLSSTRRSTSSFWQPQLRVVPTKTAFLFPLLETPTLMQAVSSKELSLQDTLMTHLQVPKYISLLPQTVPALENRRELSLQLFAKRQLSSWNLGASRVLISTISPQSAPVTRMCTRYLVEELSPSMMPVPVAFRIFLNTYCPFIFTPTPYSISYCKDWYGRWMKLNSISLCELVKLNSRAFNGSCVYSVNSQPAFYTFPNIRISSRLGSSTGPSLLAYFPDSHSFHCTFRPSRLF